MISFSRKKEEAWKLEISWARACKGLSLMLIGNRMVPIKVEKPLKNGEQEKNHLAYEFEMLKVFMGSFGFPKAYTAELRGNYPYVVMKKVGKGFDKVLPRATSASGHALPDSLSQYYPLRGLREVYQSPDDASPVSRGRDLQKLPRIAVHSHVGQYESGLPQDVVQRIPALAWLNQL